MRTWVKVRQLDAVNNGLLAAAPQVLSELVSLAVGIPILLAIAFTGIPLIGAMASIDPASYAIGFVGRPIAFFIVGAVGALVLSFVLGLGLTNGFDAFVEGPDSWLKPGAGPQWVKMRLQKIGNSAVVGLLTGPIFGAIAGIALYLASALGFLPAVFAAVVQGIPPYLLVGLIVAGAVLGALFHGVGAWLANFVRQTSFVNGWDVLVQPEKGSGGEGGQWVRIVRLGAVNTGKKSALELGIVGTVAGFLAGLFLTLSSATPATALLLFIPAGALGAELGLVIGALQAAVLNFCMSLSFINGWRMRVSMPSSSARRK